MNFTEKEMRATMESIAAFEHEIWSIQTAVRAGENPFGAYNEFHPRVIRRRCREALRMVRIAEERMKS